MDGQGADFGGASANAALQASIEALAQSRAAQMLIAQLESQLLLGLNEQVSCGNCGGGGVGCGDQKALSAEIGGGGGGGGGGWALVEAERGCARALRASRRSSQATTRIPTS